ncbi:MAG TPA: hypothetical protein VFM98_25985, partial [Ramlibacter sp.]|uniref:hypothetical protein n=1 Tax=Ramlibacter sp. TaxID=1917967 RepID=UPI002D7EDCA4
ARPGSEPVGEEALIGIAPPPVLMPPATEFALAPLYGVEIPGTSRTLATAPVFAGDLVLVGFNPQDAGEFRILGLNGLDLGASGLTMEQFQQTLRSGVFLEELNRLRNELRQEFDLEKSMSVSVAGLSLGVSVAYVLWLVRGGVLLGSYLSALPAWRLLDPLPVLGRAHGSPEEDEEDDEPLAPDEAARADPLRGFS